MNGFVQYIKNQIYLSKFNIKEKIMNNLAVDNPEQYIESILYLIPSVNIKRPNVINRFDTVDLIVKSDKCLARFGDGEISLILGNSIPFQSYSEDLAKKLANILLNKQKNLLVGINYYYFYPEYNIDSNEINRHFLLNVMPKLRANLVKQIDFNTQYVDAGFTGMATKKNSSWAIYDKISQVWDNKKVLIVGCKDAIHKIKYDIYESASEKQYIYVPNKNAYDYYDDIYNEILKYDKSFLVILMCGPCAKVLAADLANADYRALDLGHLQKSYDYYERNVDLNNENCTKFWAPD